MGKILKGIDIRKFGSGNVGATNALRVLGTKIGITTLLLDAAKGAVPVIIAKKFDFEGTVLVIIALSAILGHIFTIFLKFKGGKGVATSAGVFGALTPIPFCIALASFILIVIFTKYISLGSIVSALILAISELVINLQNNFAEREFLVFVSIIALLIIVRHKDNILRLKNGNENKISFGKK
jgi:glycerol-3-phosphate acyltransferase PlsY